jgi:hypothetical protein
MGSHPASRGYKYRGLVLRDGGWTWSQGKKERRKKLSQLSLPRKLLTLSKRFAIEYVTMLFLRGLDSSGSELGPVTGSCYHDYEASGSIKGGGYSYVLLDVAKSVTNGSQ